MTTTPEPQPIQRAWYIHRHTPGRVVRILPSAVGVVRFEWRDGAGHDDKSALTLDDFHATYRPVEPVSPVAPGVIAQAAADWDTVEAGHPSDEVSAAGRLKVEAFHDAAAREHDVHIPALLTAVEGLGAALAEARADLEDMAGCRDQALRMLHRDDYRTPVDLREEVEEGLYGIAEWDETHGDPEAAPDWLVNAVMGAVHEHYARAIERADKADAELAQLRAKNDNLVRQVVDNAKRDVARISGRALAAAWEALRDAPGGPLLDAMNVITDLAEQRLAPATTTETDQ